MSLPVGRPTVLASTYLTWLLLPTYCGCKAQCKTFKQLSSSRDLMSAWQGGGLHSQVPQMSEHSPDGKAKVRGTKEGPSCVSLQKIRGYNKSQHLSWGKVQLKKSPWILHPLSCRVEQCGFHAGWNSGFYAGWNSVVSMQGGTVWFPCRVEQWFFAGWNSVVLCRVEQWFHAGWNSGWPISVTGRLNLYG